MTLAVVQPEDFDDLDEEQFAQLEKKIEQLTAVWQIKNLRGQSVIFHDDQHLGEKRRQLFALNHSTVDADKITAVPKPLVDSLEGNSLFHPLTTPIIEVDESSSKARGVWWSIGVEGLSKFREKPMAIFSIGIVPGVHVKEDGEWRILWGVWQRTTKNDQRSSWVHSMELTNARPALTPEQDRAWLGRFAYRKDEARQPVPEPPRKNTWDEFPDEADASWQYLNLAGSPTPTD